MNCQYLKVLLTSAEAKLLRQGNWEARAFCSSPLFKWARLALPLGALLGAVAFLRNGDMSMARLLLVGGLSTGLMFAAPFLPVYTVPRSRVLRGFKWMALGAILVLASVASGPRWSWLYLCCLWPIARVEWMRISIRRKLPVSDWPKQLYL